jgi:hypothetical protein
MKRLLALAVLLTACAHQMRPDDQLAADRQELARLESELIEMKAEGRPPDCPRASQLGDNICLLSERICALVARLPPDPAQSAQCTDARARCASARERVKAACPKP